MLPCLEGWKRRRARVGDDGIWRDGMW